MHRHAQRKIEVGVLVVVNGQKGVAHWEPHPNAVTGFTCAGQPNRLEHSQASGYQRGSDPCQHSAVHATHGQLLQCALEHVIAVRVNLSSHSLSHGHIIMASVPSGHVPCTDHPNFYSLQTPHATAGSRTRNCAAAWSDTSRGTTICHTRRFSMCAWPLMVYRSGASCAVAACQAASACQCTACCNPFLVPTAEAPGLRDAKQQLHATAAHAAALSVHSQQRRLGHTVSREAGGC